ncbi:MAG: type I restriction-modification enzyme R subunit C-terminal domain-containing protein [Planctomycetaceae bacterium]
MFKAFADLLHSITTGLDAPTCRNVVLLRMVNSMVEFKQIIGRGTRVRDDYGKLWFNILDYTGTASTNFADPAFDGEPAFASQEEIDEHGQTQSVTAIETEGAVGEPDQPETGGTILGNPPVGGRTKIYFDGGQVEIVAELVHELDPDGKQLRVVKLTDYTAEKVRTICPNQEELRSRWADSEQREAMLQELALRGIDVNHVAAQAGTPGADPFDLLCHLAYNTPVLTRRQRADRVKRHQAGFFNYYGPEARDILNLLLEKYAADGELQFTLPDVLKVPPISSFGNVNEIIGKFGGADNLRTAVGELQSLIYAG